MKIRDRIKSLRRVKSKDLLPNPKNWRTHSENQKDVLRGILAEVGIADVLLVRETPDGLMLIDGHLRADIDADIKWPCLVLDVTEAEADKLLATIDPLAAMAETNDDALLSEIETESEALRNMLDDLVDKPADPPEDPGAQIDRAAELQKEWKTERGQLWEITGESGQVHRLLCGDSTVAADVERVMGGERAGLVTADPPYGVEYTGGSGKIWDSFRNDPKDPMQYAAFVCDILKSGSLVSEEDAALYLWFSDSQMGAIDFAVRESGWFRRCLIFWIKDRFTFSRATTHYRQQHEPCLYAGASQSLPAWHGPNNESTRWEIAKPQAHEFHPTQKPVELYVRMLKNSTTPGDVVLELCLGSGTTMVAAEQLNRRCYGIEISPAYCAVILERMKDMGATTELK